MLTSLATNFHVSTSKSEIPSRGGGISSTPLQMTSLDLCPYPCERISLIRPPEAELWRQTCLPTQKMGKKNTSVRTVLRKLGLVKFFGPKKFYCNSRRIKSFQVISDQLFFFGYKGQNTLKIFVVCKEQFRTVLCRMGLVKFFGPKNFYCNSRRIKSFQVISDQLFFFGYKGQNTLKIFRTVLCRVGFAVDGPCSGGCTAPDDDATGGESNS